MHKTAYEMRISDWSSDVCSSDLIIEAPCRIFNAQEELQQAFKAGELERDVVCVVRWQGTQANGMPELHKLTPPLAVLQGKRPEERRVGKECVSACRSRWSPYPSKKQPNT